MNVLIVLAFNEELYLEKTILSNIDYFDKVVVVDDKSSDNTVEIVKSLKAKNDKISLIQNEKNYGPGRSLNLGINEALKFNPEFIVKADGDNQFDSENIIELLTLAKKNSSDFIKCDRFWSGGIKGEIPKIRYFGNAFASFLIKVVTGNWNITDPLNGLFLFSKNLAKETNIPKFFNRYGYPFYINLSVSKYNIKNPINIHQYKNTVSYRNEKSRLSPLGVFLKLIIYSVYHFISNIKTKLKYSNYQMSGLVDISSILVLLFSLISFYMFLISRFFGYQGNQHTWFLLFLLSFVGFIFLILQSIKSIKVDNSEIFKYIN